MSESGPRRDSLALPAFNQSRRSSWRDSIGFPFGGPRLGSLPSESTSSSTGLSSDRDTSTSTTATTPASRFSLSTLLGLSAPSVSTADGKPKGEKARSLLRLLLKNQRSPETSGSDLTTDVHNLVPCGDVVGLLAVSVKQLRDFTPKFNVKRDTNLLVRISIDKIMKCTNPQVYKANQKTNKKTMAVNFGDVRYFSVKVPNRKSDHRNRIVLELVGFEGPKDFPRLFGTVTMHLYEVIQRQTFTEICALRIRNMVFCTIEVEFMFCYGCLGYGYSHQLKIPGADPAKAVACSMFMRVPPPQDRKDFASNVIKPQLMDYPAFLSPDLNVTVGNLDLEAPPVDSEVYQDLQRALKEPPRERLVKMKEEYLKLKTWREKADYLDQLILKNGPKTKPGLSKVSRFRQIVGRMQRPLSKLSTSSSAEEKVIREENQSALTMDFPDSVSEIPSSISEIPRASKCPVTDSEAESEKDRDFPASADTILSVPMPTVTSSTSGSSHPPLDSMESMERKPKRLEVYHESETSLSGSDSNVEAGDSESAALESPESKAVEEEPAPPAKRESVVEYPLSTKESYSRSEVSVQVADEVEAPKLSESVNKILPQWSWKEVEFQEASFSGNKFEPFLRHIKGVQPPEPPKGKTGETSVFSHLEQTQPCVETKEQEDQDPPHQMPPTKAVGSSDTKSAKGGGQLSILRLIEKKIAEEEPQLPVQKEKDPKPPAVKSDLSQKQPEKALSASEVKQVHISFKRSVENFLVNRLTKVIALKSLLSKHVENLVEERLLESEIAEELEDSLDTAESLPDTKGKHFLMGRKPCSGQRLSEQDISNLKAAASQNLQASLIGKLSAHGIIPGTELAEHKQKASGSSSAEGDLFKRKKHLSKESISPPDIITIKSLSDGLSGESSKSESMPSSQENGLIDRSESKMDDRESALCHKSHSSSRAGTSTEKGLDKKCSSKSLEIIRVRLPESTETEFTKKSLDNLKLSDLEASPKSVPNKTDTLIEKLLKTEIASLKSFLSKGLQDHLKDKLSETGLSTREGFEKVCRELSLNAKDELAMALEKALPEGGQGASKEKLPEMHPTKRKSAFNESIQTFVLDTLSESEVANLKSVLNKKIQDHLLERLSEIGLITEEELRKVLENFFPVVTQETLPKGNNEKFSIKKGETAHSTSSLTQSLQDRFSEEELKNLKSLLNRLLKEDHRDKLSESDIKGLTSVLRKNFKDLPVQITSETGISQEVEVVDQCLSTSFFDLEGSSSGGSTINVSEKEKSHSKDSLSKVSSGEKLGLDRRPGLPVHSAFEEAAMHKETQTSGFMTPPQKVALKGEKPDSSVSSVLGADSGIQTSGSTVKVSSKKECHRLQSSDKPDVPNSKRGRETVLRKASFDEPLTRISDSFTSSSLTRTSEAFTSSSFLSAHDIGVQSELKNYLCKPPGYLSKPTFPVNPQTFLFLHSESEEEAKLASKPRQKPKGRKKHEKSSRKDSVPHHPQPGVIGIPVKKEKTTSGIISKDVAKEKGRKHCEPPSSKLNLTESKRDIKTTASPSLVRVESLKQKRDEVKPKKPFSKIAAPPEPHLQSWGKNTLPEKSSLSKFPGSWRATGNPPVRTVIV